MSDEVPFARYDGGGRVLLGRPAGGDGSSRRGYGVPVFRQCGTTCVYCGCNLSASYEVWLGLSIDHVVPRGDGRHLAYPAEWIEDIANLVTCCRACNEFLNGYRVADPPPVSIEEFFDLRDRHFHLKREWVLARHLRERSWYEKSYPSPSA